VEVRVEIGCLDTSVDHDRVARSEREDPDVGNYVRNHVDGCWVDEGSGFSDLRNTVEGYSGSHT
jgi:hypothetical protein